MRRALPALLLGLGCADAPPAEPSPATQPVVMLVSFDTTRADALSCYGGAGARTPVLDKLAAGGVRFAWAITQSPTTLSSHTAALSGQDSHGHRVVRNGFPVPADVPLATERFRDAGWDTVAVVGAFALEQKMGLSRGFRLYEDSAWMAHIGDYVVPADQVTDKALAAIDQRDPTQPLFLFVHYYDPHMTWHQAPEALRRQFIDPDYQGVVGNTIPHLRQMTNAASSGQLTAADARQARGLYLAEVAWADSQLGRLLQGMTDRGLLDEALVMMMSDHGEVLDDIQARPFRHGPDVDLAATHVPLLAWGQGRFETPKGLVVDDLVRVQDVAATLLGQAGLDAKIGESRDLSATWTNGAPPLAPAPAFAEANRPHQVTQVDTWPNILLERGVALDGYLYTRAPWLDTEGHVEEGLFRLDDAQTPVDDPAVKARLKGLLAAWDEAAPGPREAELSPETRAALEALGYLDPNDRPPAPASDAPAGKGD